MGADVVEPFALLRRIEEPRRSDIRRSRNDLHQMMNALHVRGWIGCSPLHDLAKRPAVVHECPLNDRRDLEPLGHDVVRDQAPGIGLRQCRLHLRQIVRLQNPRLVGQHAETGVDRPGDLIDLQAVAPREDHHVARVLVQHAIDEVRAGVHFELPRGRALLARVERRNPVQVSDEIGSERSEHVDASRNVRIHLLLNERRMEMTRGERHEPYSRHGAATFLQRPCGADEGGCDEPCERPACHSVVQHVRATSPANLPGAFSIRSPHASTDVRLCGRWFPGRAVTRACARAATRAYRPPIDCRSAARPRFHRTA